MHAITHGGCCLHFKLTRDGREGGGGGGGRDGGGGGGGRTGGLSHLGVKPASVWRLAFGPEAVPTELSPPRDDGGLVSVSDEGNR